MMHQWIRTVRKDDSVFSDISLSLQSKTAVDGVLVADEDAIYIGQYFPFNNFFLNFGTVNSGSMVSSSLSIKYWTGSGWTSAVEILDGTKTGDDTFKQKGVVQFVTNRDNQWQRIDDTSLQSGFDFASPKIYDLFWAKIEITGEIAASTTINTLDYAFTTDSMLVSIDPEINNFLTGWGGSGKTSWIDEIRFASQKMVLDLKARNLILNNGQVILFDDVSIPCAYYTLNHIYNGLGTNYREKRDDALKEYSVTLKSRFTFDRNNNARVEPAELRSVVGRAYR